MRVALHAEGSYEDVLALISEGLGWAHNDERSGRLANKAAILHARDRLGPEPMALLFEGGPKPLAAQDAPGCRLAGRRLVAIDGACLDLPDTLANDTHLGAPVGQCGPHAMFDAVIGPCTTSQNAARAQLLGRLEPGMSYLADLGFHSFKAWENARGTETDLLCRVKDSPKLEPVQDLPDGSWTGDVFDSVADRAPGTRPR